MPRVNPNYQFNIDNYGDAGGEPPFFPDPPMTSPQESLAPSPFEGGNMQTLLASMGAGGPMRSTQPVPMGPDAFSSAPQAPQMGAGVSGSGLLDPTEFNLEIKDKLAKKAGGAGQSEVGSLSNLGALPEGIRSALSRFGGMRGMHGGGGFAAGGPGGSFSKVDTSGSMPEGFAGSNPPVEADAIRAAMASRLGRR